MRSTFDTEDLQAIAEMVARKLAPLLAKVQEAVERPVLSAQKAGPIGGSRSCALRQGRG
jgi:hypothetical protein